MKFGMVIDFTDLKKIVKEEIVDQFDHATEATEQRRMSNWQTS